MNIVVYQLLTVCEEIKQNVAKFFVFLQAKNSLKHSNF